MVCGKALQAAAVGWLVRWLQVAGFAGFAGNWEANRNVLSVGSVSVLGIISDNSAINQSANQLILLFVVPRSSDCANRLFFSDSAPAALLRLIHHKSPQTNDLHPAPPTFRRSTTTPAPEIWRLYVAVHKIYLHRRSRRECYNMGTISSR